MEETKLQEWANSNEPAENLIYKPGYWEQIIFIRDCIPEALCKDSDNYMKICENISIISSHTSKSVKLPVFKIELDYGLKLILRDNFHGWVISVDSPKSLNLDSVEFINKDERITSIFCEGFFNDLVYESYSNNNKKFTIRIRNNYQLYTFCWFIRKQI